MSRLIDADALSRVVKLAWDTSDSEDFEKSVFIAIATAPTIERKKGKWNVYYHGETDFSYSCNQCGYSAPYGQYGGEYSQKKWRFCPNCGADMRGGQNE